IRAVRGCLETLHGSAAQCQSRHQSQRRFPAERATMFQAHADACWVRHCRSEEHTSELQSLMRISYAVFCLKKKITIPTNPPVHMPHTTHQTSSQLAVPH